MASLEQFRKIAVHCDKYNLDEDSSNSLKSMSEQKYESCTNCTHFTSEHTCELDLIDKVLSSLAMELEFKD